MKKGDLVRIVGLNCGHYKDELGIIEDNLTGSSNPFPIIVKLFNYGSRGFDQNEIQILDSKLKVLL